MTTNIPKRTETITNDNSSNQMTINDDGPTTETSKKVPTTVNMTAADATNTVAYVAEDWTTTSSQVTEDVLTKVHGSTELELKTEVVMTTPKPSHEVIGCCCQCCSEDSCYICSNGSVDISVDCASRLLHTNQPQATTPQYFDSSSSTPHFSASPVLVDSKYNRLSFNSDFLKGETLIETMATIPEEVKINMGHHLKMSY